jgi:nitroreductase
MGYDSCPMIGFDPVKVAEVINLPSDHVIGFMIAVGKAVKPAMPKGWPVGPVRGGGAGPVRVTGRTVEWDA